LQFFVGSNTTLCILFVIVSFFLYLFVEKRLLLHNEQR